MGRSFGQRTLENDLIQFELNEAIKFLEVVHNFLRTPRTVENCVGSNVKLIQIAATVTR